MQVALITRSEAAELSGTSPATVKKAIDQRVIPTKRRRSQSYIAIDDVPVLTMLGLLTDMRLSIKHKQQLRAWLRTSDAAPELELLPTVVVRRVRAVDEARGRAERYSRLRDRWIVRDPEIKGGEPTIKGTRVGVYTLAGRIARDSDEVLAEDLSHVPAQAREIAVQYARANPRRGRPKGTTRARRSGPRRQQPTRPVAA